MNEVKRIDIAEFRERGYLQEVNRCFLHPLGLALEVHVDDDGTERLGGVWDYRDDPEGMEFGEDMIDAEKAEAIRQEFLAKLPARRRRGLCGVWISYGVQRPTPGGGSKL